MVPGVQRMTNGDGNRHVTDISPGAHKCQTWRVRMTGFMCEDSWGLSKSDSDVVEAPVQNAPTNPNFLSGSSTI